MNKQPVFYDITMMPNINLRRFISRNLENKSLFNILRTLYDIEVTGGEQRLMAILADDKIQEYLNVKEGHPILHINRKMETSREAFLSTARCIATARSTLFLGRFNSTLK